MAKNKNIFFFELDGRVFKTSKEVTIGRVTPFDFLSENFDVSRLHCKIFVKKNALFITPLSENAKVIINGKKLKFAKSAKVSEEDTIRIANLSLKILLNYEKDDFKLIVSKKSKEFSPIVSSFLEFITKLNPKKSISVMSAIIALLMILADKEEVKDLDTTTSFILNFIFVFIFISIFYLLFKTFLSLIKGIDKVVLGDESLTIIKDDKNFTIQFEEITHLYKIKKLVFIKSNGKFFILNKNFDPEKIYKSLSKKIDEDVVGKFPPELKYILILLTAFFVFSEVSDSATSLETESISNVLKIISVITVFKILSPFNFSKKTFFITIIFIALCEFNFYDFSRDSLNALKGCSKEKTDLCKKVIINNINLKFAPEDQVKNLTEYLCQNDDYKCKLIKKRSSDYFNKKNK